MSETKTQKLISRVEAAEVLGVCLRTIDELVSKGDLKVIRIGAAVRIRPSAIEDFCEARESRNNPRRRARSAK